VTDENGDRGTGTIIAAMARMLIQKDQELNVITKTYDLILWSCNHTSKFPRNHRFVLWDRVTSVARTNEAQARRVW
jgi:hypothetical protein